MFLFFGLYYIYSVLFNCYMTALLLRCTEFVVCFCCDREMTGFFFLNLKYISEISEKNVLLFVSSIKIELVSYIMAYKQDTYYKDNLINGVHTLIVLFIENYFI